MYFKSLYILKNIHKLKNHVDDNSENLNRTEILKNPGCRQSNELPQSHSSWHVDDMECQYLIFISEMKKGAAIYGDQSSCQMCVVFHYTHLPVTPLSSCPSTYLSELISSRILIYVMTLNTL